MTLTFDLGQYMTTRSVGQKYLMTVTAVIEKVGWKKKEYNSLRVFTGLY